MNSGAITKRYATALLRYTLERGSGAAVCEQVRAMLRTSKVPPRLEPDLGAFVALLQSHGRVDYLRRILRTYVDMYCEATGLRHVVLTSAVPSKELEERVRQDLEKRYGGQGIMMETEVDPELIGGFRVEVDGRMLDGSVRRQLEILRREFIEKNNRIV